MGLSLRSSLTLSCQSGILSLPGLTLCLSLLTSRFLSSGPGLSLRLFLLSLGLGYTSLVLLTGSLSSRLLPCQFLCPTLSLSLCSFTLGFCLSTSLSTSYLLSNHTIDLGIQLSITLLLFVNDALDGLLLFLQRVHHLLLLYLFVLQRFFLLFTTIEQIVFLSLGSLQFVIGLLHLCLHRNHGFALRLLIRCVFVDKAHPAVHLREVLGTEDEHHTTLDITITIHIAHGLQITLFALSQFLFQHLQLILQQIDVTVEFGDIVADGIDGFTFISNLVVDNQQVLQSFVHIALISLQLQFLLLNRIAHLLLLFLQTTNGRLIGCGSGLFLGSSLGGLLGCGCFLGSRFLGCLFLCSRTCLRGSRPLLLSRNSCHEAHQ